MQQAPYAAAGSLNAARFQQVAIPHEAPYAAAGSQQGSRLPMLHTSSSMLQAANMWRYRTASGSQRQCCCLASGSLYGAPMLQSLALCCGCQVLLAVKLPAVNCPPNNCQPTEPARRLLPALYTAAVWPRPYCRLTSPVQPITARRLLASAAAQPIRTLPLCTHVNSFERMSATIHRDYIRFSMYYSVQKSQQQHPTDRQYTHISACSTGARRITPISNATSATA
jgi:hypothetical protein